MQVYVGQKCYALPFWLRIDPKGYSHVVELADDLLPCVVDMVLDSAQFENPILVRWPHTYEISRKSVVVDEHIEGEAEYFCWLTVHHLICEHNVT